MRFNIEFGRQKLELEAESVVQAVINLVDSGLLFSETADYNTADFRIASGCGQIADITAEPSAMPGNSGSKSGKSPGSKPGKAA